MKDAKVLTGLPIWARMLGGFVAGFLATLIFHQLTLALLKVLYNAPIPLFSMKPTSPFGVPAVFSLAFWGGIWGIIFVMIHQRFPGGGGYWLSAFLFGGIAPTLVALLVVLPLKGKPLGADWKGIIWLTAFLINGAWGIGTGVFLKFIFSRYRVAKPISTEPGRQPPPA